MGKYALSERGLKLNQLGQKYVSLVREDQFYYVARVDPTKKPKKVFDLNKRSNLQVRIANAICSRLENFFKEVANSMLEGAGIEIRKDRWISLNGFEVPSISDLAHDGMVAVLENLHKYNEDYSMTTFVKQKAADRMYLSASKYTQIPLPKNMFRQARTVVGKSDLEKTSSEAISSIPLERGSRMNENVVSAISSGAFGSRNQSIDKPAYEDDGESWSGIHLEYEDNVSADVLLEKKNTKLKVRSLLNVADKRERDVLHLRLVEEWSLEKVGEKYGVCRERARQIQKSGLIDIAKPLERMFA